MVAEKLGIVLAGMTRGLSMLSLLEVAGSGSGHFTMVGFTCCF